MIKSLFTAAAILAFVAPTAQAGVREDIEVAIKYNPADLETTKGAESVTKSVAAQARKACKITVGVSQVSRLDRQCMTEVVEAAMTKINEKAAG